MVTSTLRQWPGSDIRMQGWLGVMLAQLAALQC
jgi:hypothetical protein